VRESSVRECSRGGFLEYTLAGQEAENAVESRFAHTQFAGQVRGGLHAIFQQIGYSELCCGVQSLMNDETVRHAQELATIWWMISGIYLPRFFGYNVCRYAKEPVQARSVELIVRGSGLRSGI